MGNKLALRFLGLQEMTQDTLEQSYGVPPVSVALDNPTLREEASFGCPSGKTVRNIVFRKSPYGQWRWRRKAC